MESMPSKFTGKILQYYNKVRI